MGNHHVEPFADAELSVAGHTALVGHNHNTGAQSLSCDDCDENLGRFAPDRWREKHIRDAWKKHLADQVITACRPNAEPVAEERGPDHSPGAAIVLPGITCTIPGHCDEFERYLDEALEDPDVRAAYEAESASAPYATGGER